MAPPAGGRNIERVTILSPLQLVFDLVSGGRPTWEPGLVVIQAVVGFVSPLSSVKYTDSVSSGWPFTKTIRRIFSSGPECVILICSGVVAAFLDLPTLLLSRSKIQVPLRSGLVRDL